MTGYVRDVEQATADNVTFRRVVYSTPLLQLHLLSLRQHEEIGMKRRDADYFYMVVEGSGEAVVDGARTVVRAGWGLQCPSSAQHNIINTGPVPLKLFALCAPPHMRQGAAYRTRAEEEIDNGTAPD